MLNRSSPGVNAIPCLNLEPSNSKEKLNEITVKTLFSQSCWSYSRMAFLLFKTFKCLNKLIVHRVGTERNIAAMIITGFVDNLFIVRSYKIKKIKIKNMFK